MHLISKYKGVVFSTMEELWNRVKQETATFFNSIGSTRPPKPVALPSGQPTLWGAYIAGMRAHMRAGQAEIRYKRKGETEWRFPGSFERLLQLFKEDLASEEDHWWLTALVDGMMVAAVQIDNIITGAWSVPPTWIRERVSHYSAYSSVNSYVVPIHAAWLAEKFGWQTELVPGTEFTTVRARYAPTIEALLETFQEAGVPSEGAHTQAGALDGIISHITLETLDFTFEDTKRMYAGGIVHSAAADANATKSLFFHFCSNINNFPLLAVRAIGVLYGNS